MPPQMEALENANMVSCAQGNLPKIKPEISFVL